MITYMTPGLDVVENSVFAVWKEVGKIQRLIWGGNRSNQLFNPAASAVELPTPDMLSQLILPPGQRLFLAGCDISQYYNRLRAPDFLIPSLGLPRVRASLVDTELRSEFVVPCLLCIPMGATFAVQLAQTASIALVRRAGLGFRRAGKGWDRTLRGGMGTQLNYIDDCNSLGTSRSGVNTATGGMIRTLKEYGSPTADHKLKLALEYNLAAAALGLWWWPDGILTIKPDMARRLHVRTELVLVKGRATPAEMRSILGSWTWACLLQRGTLSDLDTVYQISSEEHSSRAQQLSTKQRIELSMLLDLFPVIYADVRRPFSQRVYASDASTTGGGVVYSAL